MNPDEAKFYNKRFEFISRISSTLKVLKGFKPFLRSEGLPFAILSYRRCIGCRKKRSLRANSWFEEFPRISLSMLLLCVYYFVYEDTQRKIARRLNMNQALKGVTKSVPIFGCVRSRNPIVKLCMRRNWNYDGIG